VIHPVISSQVQRKLDLISNLRYNWRLVDHLQRLVSYLDFHVLERTKVALKKKHEKQTLAVIAIKHTLFPAIRSFYKLWVEQ